MTKTKSSLKYVLFVFSILFLSSIFLSRIIPPFMSPDEDSHVKRAYLLSKGIFFLSVEKDQSSGGYIDNGLLKYIDDYRSHIEKVLPYNRAYAASVSWQHTLSYSPIPGTGYYLPIIYIPQAIAFLIGEHFNLKISSSFYFARFLNILSEYAILIISVFIYKKNIRPLALLLLPMTLFQAATANIDGLSLAIFILCLSLFFKTQESPSPDIGSIYLLGFLETILITCRFQAAPLLLLFIPLFYRINNKKIILTAFISTFSIISFLVFALKNTVHHRPGITVPVTQIIFFYVTHPLTLNHIIVTTVSNPSTFNEYIHQYFGVLGWLDISLHHKSYLSLEILTGLAMIMALPFKFISIKERIFFVFLGLISIFCIFFPLLVTYTPYPSDIVAGVQGRYFTMASLFFAYALSIRKNSMPKLQNILFLSICSILFIFSFYTTTNSVIKKYYKSPYLPQIVQTLAK